VLFAKQLSSHPNPSRLLKWGGEELFPESAVTPLVELVIAPRWEMVGCLVALRSQHRRWMVPTSAYANFCQIFSKMGFDDNSPVVGECESPRIHWFRWWAWVDLNHQPRPYQCSGRRSRAWYTRSLMSTGACFNRADDLASVPSDWIAGRRTQLDVVIDASQTAAWRIHLVPEVSSHC
jgi:hypothetical protein